MTIDSEGRIGRVSVAIEQETSVADPGQAQAYHTNVLDFENSFSNFQPQRGNSQVGQASATPLSQIPTYSPNNVVVFYRHFDGRTYFRCHAPGDKLNVVDRPMRDADKHAYAAQWLAYQDGKQQQIVGTPLRELPRYRNHPNSVTNFYKNDIYTVEQLAALNDYAVEHNKIDPEIVQEAQDFLRPDELKKQLDVANERITKLEARIIELERGPQDDRPTKRPRERL